MSDIPTKFIRENSIKMQLPNASSVSTTSCNNSESSSLDSEIMIDDCPNKFMRYLRQVAGNYEFEVDAIMKEHCYARPWNWRPENIYVKPVKKLFFPKHENRIVKKLADEEEFIDVEDVDPEPPAAPCDFSKATQAMDEFERVAHVIRPEDTDDWEENIDKILWSPIQTRIFARVIRILNSERLARLSRANSRNEPILRRTSIENTAKKFREAMTSASWDLRIIQWLHNLLFDYLPQEYLAIYLDILQVLRQKIPQLIEKMTALQPNINSKGSSITWDTLSPLLKKSWEPVSPTLTTSRPKKLPGNPVIVIVPNGITNTISPRKQRWIAHLGTLAPVVTVNTHIGLTTGRMTVITVLEQIIQATRTRLQGVRVEYAGKPIILVGFNTGAAIACQVALLERITAVVCMGFPMNTVDGKRGNMDDCLLDIRVPVMFVIGQNSSLAQVDDIEHMRERMLVQTSLVVVGSADDQLNISTSKKIAERISQSMVDRCIVDEIADFIGEILVLPHSTPIRSITSLNNLENRHKKPIPDRKRKTSTSSSLDSEPQSPVLKKLKPLSPSQANANNGHRMSVSTNVLPRGTMVTLTGTTATQTPRRKPKGSFANQNLPDHLITSRLTPQQQNMDNSTGGITLNIGSFASLAPVGPIRFEPTSISLQSSASGKAGINTLKTSNAFIKVSKGNQVNFAGQQSNVAKIKMIMPTKKQGQRSTNNYKNLNLMEKTGEINMVNVLSPSSTGIRVSAPTATVTNIRNTSGVSNAPPLPTFHVTKSTVGATVTGQSATSANVVFAGKNSVTTTMAAVTTTASKIPSTVPTKVTDISMSGGSRKHTTIRTNVNSHPDQLSTSTKAGVGATAKERSSKFGLVPKISLKRIPMPAAKIETPENNVKANTELCEPAQMTLMDDDLANILDIPIIIANDGENLNNLEPIPPLPQMMTPVTLQSTEVKSLPVINAVGNKVVFINNKNLISSTDAISTTNTATLTRPGLTAQPTIKYTKIILTKKPEHEESQRNNPVILAKTNRRANNFMVIDPKSEVKYAQTVTRIPANSLGEQQSNDKVVGSAQNSKVPRTKQTNAGPNVENGGKF